MRSGCAGRVGIRLTISYYASPLSLIEEASFLWADVC
jgi:hypothetical protein